MRRLSTRRPRAKEREVFDTVGGLPLHALVLHVVVIAVPLATLLALLFAYPRTRNWARWPLAVVAVGTLGATFVTKESGQELRRALKIQPGNPVGDLIEKHEQLANQLLILVAIFTVIAVASSLLVSRLDVAPRRPPVAIEVGLPVLLVISALVMAFWVYRVGDIGSRAVWNPEGTVNYST
jgi:MFS superfamily sulfate permease-like transporter